MGEYLSGYPAGAPFVSRISSRRGWTAGRYDFAIKRLAAASVAHWPGNL